MALTGFNGRCCCLLFTIILGLLSQSQSNPLVYPNRFSFQKTSTTSTTDLPLHDHDHSNNSISSFGNAIATESGLPSSYARGFRYDIAAWVIGALLLVGLLFLIFYPRKRRNELSTASSSCYVFPANSNPNLKTDLDSSSIIGNTNSENT